MKQTLSKWLALGLTFWLTGCNLTTGQPLFSAADAADVKLQSGYYATSTDVAYIKVYGGKTIVNTQTDQRRPYDALAVDLGDGVFLLQYGHVDEAARTYVLFRYEQNGAGISTAIYDCGRDAPYFKNFGVTLTVAANGFCRMEGVTKESMVRLQRAIAKALPSDSWHRTYKAVPYEEGATAFKERDGFLGRPR